MPNLEPNVRMGKRTWRIAENTIEAVERLVILALLLVDDSKTEENLVCLVKI
jgi:hypothetical protein